MNKEHKQYLAAFIVSVFSILFFCLSINIILDPLWYFNGNQYKKYNFAFNERLTKTNQFLRTSNEYDCIIFGSSRTTLLNETLIENHNCFNYSFSGGKINELNAVASYIIDKGANPSLIIIGVDDFNFVKSNQEDGPPDYIINKTEPQHFLKSYLSLDALYFSIRLLRNKSPLPRYYDIDFVGNILPTAPQYNPRIERRNNERFILRESEYSDDYHLNSVERYFHLVKLFNTSEVIGYVPPISAWEIASKDRTSLLNYLESIYRVSRFISPFYDFSIPSEITSNKTNTYDGSHYNIRTNKLIADRINNKSIAFGIRVDTMTREEYLKAFQQSLNGFLSSSM